VDAEVYVDEGGAGGEWGCDEIPPRSKQHKRGRKRVTSSSSKTSGYMLDRLPSQAAASVARDSSP